MIEQMPDNRFSSVVTVVYCVSLKPAKKKNPKRGLGRKFRKQENM